MNIEFRRAVERSKDEYRKRKKERKPAAALIKPFVKKAIETTTKKIKKNSSLNKKAQEKLKSKLKEKGNLVKVMEDEKKWEKFKWLRRHGYDLPVLEDGTPDFKEANRVFDEVMNVKQEAPEYNARKRTKRAVQRGER